MINIVHYIIVPSIRPHIIIHTNKRYCNFLYILSVVVFSVHPDFERLFFKKASVNVAFACWLFFVNSFRKKLHLRTITDFDKFRKDISFLNEMDLWSKDVLRWSQNLTVLGALYRYERYIYKFFSKFNVEKEFVSEFVVDLSLSFVCSLYLQTLSGRKNFVLLCVHEMLKCFLKDFCQIVTGIQYKTFYQQIAVDS